MAQDQRDGGAGGAKVCRFPPRMTFSASACDSLCAGFDLHMGRRQGRVPFRPHRWGGHRFFRASDPTRSDYGSLQEFCQNWLARGMAINRDAAVYEQQLLDGCFHNPMRQGHAGRYRSTDLSSCDQNAWATCRDLWFIDACALVREYVRPLIRSPSHFLSFAPAKAAIRPTTRAGANLMLSMRIGPAQSKGSPLIATRWIGAARFKKSRAANAAPRISGL